MFVGKGKMPYQAEADRRAGPTLTACHIWSDGCGSQLKNRWQVWFLSSRFLGLFYSHNFFASCHGTPLAEQHIRNGLAAI